MSQNQEPKAVDTRKLLTPALIERTEKRARELLDKAAEVWPEHKAKFQDAPTIRYDVKNKFGGFAISGGADDWTVRLNLILCFENEDVFIHEIVGHEVAHLVTHVVHGFTKQVEQNGKTVTKKIRPHGKEWRAVMIELGLKPMAYHTLNTSSIVMKPRRIAKRGSKLDVFRSIEMMKRLKSGIRRLDNDFKRDLIAWIEDRIEGNDEDQGETE